MMSGPGATYTSARERFYHLRALVVRESLSPSPLEYTASEDVIRDLQCEAPPEFDFTTPTRGERQFTFAGVPIVPLKGRADYLELKRV